MPVSKGSLSSEESYPATPFSNKNKKSFIATTDQIFATLGGASLYLN